MRLSSYSTRHRHQILAGAATESAGPQMCARTSTERWDGGRPHAGKQKHQPVHTNARSGQLQQPAELSSITSLRAVQQQSADNRRQTAATTTSARPRKKKSQKDGAGTQCSVHSRLLEHTHQAAVIHAVAVVGVSQDFLHFPPASPAFCFIR